MREEPTPDSPAAKWKQINDDPAHADLDGGVTREILRTCNYRLLQQVLACRREFVSFLPRAAERLRVAVPRGGGEECSTVKQLTRVHPSCTDPLPTRHSGVWRALMVPLGADRVTVICRCNYTCPQLRVTPWQRHRRLTRLFITRQHELLPSSLGTILRTPHSKGFIHALRRSTFKSRH